MTAYVKLSTQDTTESLIDDTYAPQPKRPYVAVVVGKGKVHAWTKFGFKCGRNYPDWFVDKNQPVVTCRQCRRVLAAEGHYR